MGQSQATLRAKAQAERAERDRVTADGKLVLESFEKYVKAVDVHLKHTRILQSLTDEVDAKRKEAASDLANRCDTPKDLDAVRKEVPMNSDAMRKVVEDAIQKKHEATMRERKQFETHYSQSGLGMTTFYTDSAKPEEISKAAWVEATTIRYIEPPQDHNKTLFSTP